MPSQLAEVEYAAPPRAQSKAAALAWPPRLVVIHDTGNPTATRYQESSYAANRTDPSSGWTSAHFYVDTGGPLGSLRLNYQAWAAYSYANAHGIHIEMCGMNAGDAHAVPAQTIAVTASLVRQLCALAGIPAVKLTPTQVAAGARGVCGHRDITIGLGVGDHDDPGAKFDWITFMQKVTGGSSNLQGADVELNDIVTIPPYEQVVDAVTPKAPTTNETISVGTALGGAYRRSWEALHTAEAALAQAQANGNALNALQQQVGQPTTGQWTQLIDAITGHVDTVLAAKIGTAVEQALAGPAGRAALVAAANEAEDS